jgi:hypothetical protein
VLLCAVEVLVYHDIQEFINGAVDNSGMNNQQVLKCPSCSTLIAPTNDMCYICYASIKEIRE